MIEFCLPEEWNKDKKDEFKTAIEKKIADKLAPLSDQILKDKEKEEIKNGVV